MMPSEHAPSRRRLPLAHIALVHAQVLLLLLTPCTQAGDILHMAGAATTSASPTDTGAASVGAIDTAAATAQAQAHAQDMLARNTMALQAVTAMQDAAHAAAAGATNLGANPNFSGQILPDVPNGLGVGGLDIIGTPTGANAPQQSLENAHTIVTIQQTAQQALLNWQTFNVGSDTTVRFDQSAGGADVGTWIAFNQITDPSGNPTQILGSIEAQGQVYLINQNGIIFGAGSEVNTHAMVASALPLNTNLVTRGLLNNPDSQFLFSANAQPAGTKGPTPAFTPPSVPAFGKIASVTVQAGAHITAPTSSANVGGLVALIGPNVTNNGTISTPDGQTILAAGMQVGFDAHSSDDPSLRGLDVYVGDVGSYGGTATNAGLIEAPRGSVVITGKEVDQNGFIDSTTSAALNGRIDLLANYNAIPNTAYNAADPSYGKPFLYSSGTSTGIVRTGANSVMQIMPEYASNLTVVGTELALKSQINMQGLAVYLGSNSVILAPNANVAISAGVWDLLLNATPLLNFVEASGQVYLDQGAVVDVAGSTAVAASISDYIITVKLAASELADSELQRTGALRGQSITVDLREHGVRADGSTWVGTPLANLNGYLAAIQRNVGQLTVAGGTVTIKAGESVVMQSGALVDVSGGYQDYAAGYVQTSVLLSNGQLINIANAQPDVLYDGLYTPGVSATDPRWSTTSGSTALFAAAAHAEDAHSVGGNGGTLAIYAPAMALDGTLQGTTITGPQQLDAAPQASSLALYFEAQQLIHTTIDLPFYSPTPPAVNFSNSASGLPAAGAFALNGSGAPLTLSQARRDTVVLSPTLLSTQGFGSLLVDDSDGNISIPAGVTLTTPLAGSITLKGANVDIQGSIIAPAGTIAITAYDISPFTALILKSQSGSLVPPADPTRGRVTMGAGAQLSTAGLVLDDRPGSLTRELVPSEVSHLNADGSSSYVSTTAGGSISILGYTAELAAGSLLDVSGGFAVDANGVITYSNAGSLTVKAGNDPIVTSILGGYLTLDATLHGFSGASGGSLTLQAPMIQVGGTLPNASALLLQSDFFDRYGFANFQLIGLGINVSGTVLPGVLIAANTTIDPQVLSLQATTGSQNGANTLTVGTLLKPEGYRPAATLSLAAPGIRYFTDQTQLIVRGAVVTAAGSLIETDALGSVNFNAQTVELFGAVMAPGGSITVTGASQYPQNNAPTTAYATVHLGSTSLLSTAGKTLLLQNAYGLRTGHVYDGGMITVSGNIVADAGAVLDVSGTSAVLDLLPQQAGTATVFTAGLSMAALFPGTSVTQPVQLAQAVATQIDSNGGTLILQGGDFLFSNATLKGQAGGPTAMGGSLTVQSNRYLDPSALDYDNDIRLLVAQDMAQFAQPVFTSGSVIGQALLNSSGGSIRNIGYFGASSFTAGGFDGLTLAGNVQFVGPVNLTAAGYLNVADGGVLGANDLVSLTAPYVALGRPLAPPAIDAELTDPFRVKASGVSDYVYFSPTYGTGELVVTADLIETGILSLQNIGQATLTARQDLRGSGFFDIAGDLTLVAGQIYPVTASNFTITAYNYTVGAVTTNGSVTIASSGATTQFPLSGAGRLNIYAATITQGGTLRAPLGTITLGWDGTGTAPVGLLTNTSVPVAQQITLQSGGITSVSAIDPLTGAGVVIPYGIVVNGTNWIDPTGLDITTTGTPDKSIKVSAANISTEAGSSLDIRGGGELYGYRWVEGNGGTNDILDTNGSYAILPGYAAFFAPFAPYATSGINVANLGGDKGYANSTLAVGDRVYLQAAPGLAAGVYTLLPARYALLPGAMLVTPDATDTLTSGQVKPDGSLLTNGYQFNSLNANVTGSIYQQFEVAPLSVVKARADYTDYAANVFIPATQLSQSQAVTLTSNDAGYALLNALQTMQLNGAVTAGGYQTGRGGRVDVSSPLDIVLAAPGAAAQPGKLLLNTTLLSSWNAESLLIGGVRTFSAGSTSVTARTTNLTLDNAGAPLTGSEIILTATGTLTLASGSVLTQTSAQSTADTLSISGNGTLVRVSGVASAQISRTGATTSALPQLNIGALAQISGVSVTLDSSNATSLDPAAILSGQALNLNSGRISIQLASPGALQPSPGLVLGGTLLSNLQAASALSLLSYSAIDIYGSGTFAATGSLALHAAEIRGFNNNSSTVSFTALQSILLDNSANGAAPGSSGLNGSTLALTAAIVTIGQNNLAVDQFSKVSISTSDHLFLQGVGSLATQGGLNITTPYITAASASTQAVYAGGALTMTRPGAAVSPTGLPVGAQVSFTGASINVSTDILLPSGALSLHALTGNLDVGGLLNAGGVAATFYDVIKYTDAGSISLTADLGAVTIASTSTVNVSAATAAGSAGTFTVSAPTGLFTMNGTLQGTAGTGGSTGNAVIDVGSLVSFTALNDVLNNGMFTNSRNLRIRSGNVTINDTVNAHSFILGVDQGSITVTGTIDASGLTGGQIDLIASGSVLINSGALLTVAAQSFNDAGKGGAITLEAGSYVNNTITTSAILDVHAGSTINLSVADSNANSALHGQFTGTLHLRAPQSSSTEVMAIQAIGGTILNASSIRVEGYAVYDLTGSGVITSTVQGSINTNGTSFGGNSVSISTRLLTGNANAAALSPLLVVMPGAEVVNRTGGLTLGTPTSPVSSDWDLASFRYGPKGAPGVLTLRAAGDLTFYNTLSDGFTVLTSAPTGYTLVERMWLATLKTQNTNLPVNTQSWSFHLAAGADFSAVNFRNVVPTVTKSGTGSTNVLTLNNTTGVVVGETVTGVSIPTGTVVAAINGNQITLSQNVTAAVPANSSITFGSSLLLGKNAGQALPSSVGLNPSPGDNALTRLAINPTNGNNVTTTSNYFQVIRTGTGDIDIFTGKDVQLLNQFATIYTAGVSVPSATTIFSAGDFVLPNVTSTSLVQTGLGAFQQPCAAQYSLAGGNVTVEAGQDIIHLTRDSLGNLIADSSRELPNNWLMRRGYVDSTGKYGITKVGTTIFNTVTDSASSTTWWINYSNFFDGVAALGGGNVTLHAGRDVQNVSAHAPTNARAAKGTPSAAGLLELGGGDVTVTAGRNIDGGVYYVERGTGTLQAGGQITTNSTRSISLGNLGVSPSVYDSSSWLPTTLFVGKSTFNVSARGNVLLGPVANTFLLPQSLLNKHYYKTYFSTYAADSGVSVTSLGGNVTFREAVTMPSSGTPQSILGLWMTNELQLSSSSAANYQPWLRLVETNAEPFYPLSNLMPGNLHAVAYSGSINLVGSMTLSPSASGTIELLAGGSVNGLRPTGVSSSLIVGSQTNVWGSATLNLSDADPSSIPGVLSPYAYYQTYYNPAVTNNNTAARTTSTTFLNILNSTFAESGSTSGTYASTQVKQKLHAAGLLHLNDTTPVRIYAAGGSLSGLTLFSPKAATILAQQDITDIAFYIQNVRNSDVSVVSSGRDIIAYNNSSPLRTQAISSGNFTAVGEVPNSGDIQISGPGSLQVLAGRDLNLGTGANNSDGTGVGITSIGNGRNPYLPFAGADITLAAGMGKAAASLSSTSADFTTFITQFATSPTGSRYLSELATILGVPALDLNDSSLTTDQRTELAIAIYYLVLRDAGRDHNDPDSPNFGTYADGYTAIAALFPTASPGSIQTQARDIRTKSGGNISILAPGGGLQLAATNFGQTLAPPGIITEAGGSISIFANNSVNIGISRIFTLRGGDVTIWSSTGDIAAGSSSKTVQSAPPTRVLIDPQSANVVTDLAGLATGGGIGVLATVAGVAPANVDLIAPIGAVDAGDAGIRATGNLNIAATVVLNASNIAVGGTTAGTPAAPSVSAPSLSAVSSAASSAAAATSATASQNAAQTQQQQTLAQDQPSIITVEVIGYGGGSGDDDRKRNQPGE